MMEESSEVIVTERDGGQLSRDGSDCDVAHNNQIVHPTESEEELALFTHEAENTMGGVEERASSSLSTSSAKGSRIPRLSRSGSLREKPHRLSFDCTTTSSRGTPNELGKQNQKNGPNTRGLYRSSSFVTSRGMNDLPSPSGGRSSTPLTPELKKKKLNLPLSNSYVSPYSKKAIAAERKSLSNAGLPNSRDKENNSYFSPQVVRRSSHPVMPSHATHSPLNFPGRNVLRGAITPEEDEDDNISERSFGSVSSAQSCDVVMGFRKMSAGFWGSGGRRPRNILHCTHAHNHDPDDYLTPTQRAARKIRELQAQLKKARKEVMEKDAKISQLTRDLVELRMNKAGKKDRDDGRNTGNEVTTNVPVKKREGSYSPSNYPNGTSPPPAFFPPCLTPTSDDSEQELKILAGKKGYSRTKGTKGMSSPKTREHLSPRQSPTVVSVGGDSDSGDLSRSLADSGHYEDLPSPCLSSRDSLDAGFPSIRKIINSICSTDGGERETAMIWAAVNAAEERLRVEWVRKIEELKANHMEEYHELKERHNDKVEMLLSKLSEANLKHSTDSIPSLLQMWQGMQPYFELRPQHDKAQEQLREMEREIDRLRDELRESEIRHQKVYLQMYLKGQQAAKLEADDKFPVSSRTPSGDDSRKHLSGRESQEREDNINQSSMIFNLMKQLAQSEDEIQRLKISQNEKRSERRGRGFGSSRREEIDPEITLQFLKSAIYYFLTDRDNSPGHLRVIESILGYSTTEIGNISRSYRL